MEVQTISTSSFILDGPGYLDTSNLSQDDKDKLDRLGALSPIFFDNLGEFTPIRKENGESFSMSMFNTPAKEVQKPTEIENPFTPEKQVQKPIEIENPLDFITPEKQDNEKTVPATPEQLQIKIVHNADDVKRKIILDTPSTIDDEIKTVPVEQIKVDDKPTKKRKKPSDGLSKKRQKTEINPYKQMIEVIVSGFDDQQFSLESSLEHFKFAAARITKIEHSKISTTELLTNFNDETNCSLTLKLSICDLLIAISDEVRFTSVCLNLIRFLIESLPSSSKERRTELNYTSNVIHLLSSLPKELFVK